MSASRRPTASPSAARASARLTAVVDLPTPPLPLAIATMAPTSGASAGRSACGWGCDCCCPGPAPPSARCAVSTAVTEETPSSANTASSAAWRTGSMASPTLGSTSMAKPTLPSRMTRPLIMPAATMSRPEWGSTTVARAARTRASPSCGMVENSRSPANISCHVGNARLPARSARHIRLKTTIGKGARPRAEIEGHSTICLGAIRAAAAPGAAAVAARGAAAAVVAVVAAAARGASVPVALAARPHPTSKKFCGAARTACDAFCRAGWEAAAASR